MDQHIAFYQNSLLQAEEDIDKGKKQGKALKDIVGEVFETHRNRIWTHFGFTVTKDTKTHGALFTVDLAIYHPNAPDDGLVALEEDKGHYLDSCFMERAITGFAKTINLYKKTEKTIPTLIIHSFTTYNLFHTKMEEDLETRREDIAMTLKEKVKYTTLTSRDRIPAKDWFGSGEKGISNAYSKHANETHIQQDIEFILSLVPP